METADLTIDTIDGPMGLYEASPPPDGDLRGAVVVIQEAFGVNEHIRDVTRRLAGAGYQAVAPELFHRQGGATIGYGDHEAMRKQLLALDDEQILADVDRTLDHLRARWSDEQIGIVGFCIGGRITFLVAVQRALGAAVGFYGGGIVRSRFPNLPPLAERAATLATPWLGLFGDEDQMIPVSDVEVLEERLAAAEVPTGIVRYAGAGHGFHCDARTGYVPAAAADAWDRTLAWFDRHLSREA